MGWYSVQAAIERIDRRERGARRALREALRGEAYPPRTVSVAVQQFTAKHGRKPRYMRWTGMR